MNRSEIEIKLKNIDRPTWDEYFMGIAEWTSSRSTCPRLNVGAAVVKEGRLVATGYNGSSTGEIHCDTEGCFIENGHCLRTVHAEMNAIVNCAKQGVEIDGSTLYVTHYPCVRCMPLVIQSGIKKIYYIHNYKNHNYCQHLADVANVDVIKVESSLIKL